MSRSEAACLYQETRLGIDPASSSSVVELQVASQSSFAFGSRTSPKRRRIDLPQGVQDEKAFSKNCIATHGSIHFRPRPDDPKKQPTPRSILWRLLDDRKVLELQAVDLYHSPPQSPEPLLTLRLAFPAQIRPTLVEFAEADADGPSDALNVFVITAPGELYTLTLRREAFVKPDLLDTSNDWARNFSPPFSSRTPCRLYAKNSKELWVSLSDGDLVQLQRQAADHGSSWRVTYFGDRGWNNSVLNPLSWKGRKTIRVDDIDLFQSAAISLAMPPGGIHVWTVCTDHTVRVWNVETGKNVSTADLGGDMARDTTKAPEGLLDPGNTQLMRIVPLKDEDDYMVITFSPKHQAFKFWVVKDAYTPDIALVDSQPDFDFVPPIEELTDSAVWSLDAFHIHAPTRGRDHSWTLWLLVRSGSKQLTFSVNFDPMGPAKRLSKAWRNNWSSVRTGPTTSEELKLSLQNPNNVDISTVQSLPEGFTQQWIDFLFYPGRFSSATLETALIVYRRSFGSNVPASSKSGILNRTLKERVCELVGSSVVLGHANNRTLAFERFANDIAAQWQIFYGVVRDLHARRSTCLNLAFDSEENQPWVVMADQVSPIRTCSEIDLLWFNRRIFARPQEFNADSELLGALADPTNSQVAQLFHAISVFRDGFSKSFLTTFKSNLHQVLLQHDVDLSEDMIRLLYDRSGFSGQVSDEDYNRLTEALAGLDGFDGLDDKIFATVLDMLEEQIRGQHKRKQITRYGSRTLIKGSQEILQQGEDILLDLFLLLVFVAEELEESDLPESFNAVALFGALAVKAREFELLSWLASNVAEEPRINSDHGGDKTAVQKMTLLESIFIGDWADMKSPTGDLMHLLTYWCRAWTFGAQLSKQYDQITAHIMATLLKGGNIGLAAVFLRFLSITPWNTYLRARLYLAQGAINEAALHFTEAMPELSKGYFNTEHHDTAHILAPDERNLISEGTALYYQHVASLFEKARAMAYVADFSGLALESLDEEEEQSDETIRVDLLSRHFTSLLKTSRFHDAYHTLSQYTNLTLRKPALHSLLHALLTTHHSSLLLSLPFPPDIASDVDAYLSSLTAAPPTISSLASSPFTTHETDPSARAHHILYAFRIRNDDFQGAATCLWTRLQTLLNPPSTQNKHGGARDDNDALRAEKEQLFLAVINALCLCAEDDRWILWRPLTAAPGAKEGEKPKRRVVTLEDVRELWQAEMDWAADVEAGRFPLGMDEMDQDGVDGDGDGDESMGLDDVDGLAAMPGSLGRGGMEVDVFAA